MTTMTESETAAALAQHGARLDSMETRVSALETTTRDMTDIKVAIERQTGNIDKLTQTVSTIADRQKEHEGRLDMIEKEPATLWKNAQWLILSTAIGTAVGAVISALMPAITHI